MSPFTFLNWQVLLAGGHTGSRVDMAVHYSQLPRGSEGQTPLPEDADAGSSHSPQPPQCV